jgi:small subunit ribosomal protein S16
MVKIRLQRGGAKRRPFYRVIAIDERAKRDGRALEFLGTYNPVVDPPEIKLRNDRIEAWTQQGAQLSDAVRGLIKRARKQPQPAAAAPAPSAPKAAPAAAAPAEAAPAEAAEASGSEAPAGEESAS